MLSPERLLRAAMWSERKPSRAAARWRRKQDLQRSSMSSSSPAERSKMDGLSLHMAHCLSPVYLMAEERHTSPSAWAYSFCPFSPLDQYMVDKPMGVPQGMQMKGTVRLPGKVFRGTASDRGSKTLQPSVEHLRSLFLDAIDGVQRRPEFMAVAAEVVPTSWPRLLCDLDMYHRLSTKASTHTTLLDSHSPVRKFPNCSKINVRINRHPRSGNHLFTLSITTSLN